MSFENEISWCCRKYLECSRTVRNFSVYRSLKGPHPPHHTPTRPSPPACTRLLGLSHKLPKLRLCNELSALMRQAELEQVDITAALGLFMSTKDEDASSSLRKAAAITHKVLKHGVVRLVEDSFDQAKPITHEELATKAEEFCEDPSKIKLNVPPGQLESCYFPIIQVLPVSAVPFFVHIYVSLILLLRAAVTMIFGQQPPQMINHSPMISSSFHLVLATSSTVPI